MQGNVTIITYHKLSFGEMAADVKLAMTFKKAKSWMSDGKHLAFLLFVFVEV